MATIAYECEISSRSVQTHIRQLVKDGFVRVEERRDPSGVNRSNIYHLTFNSEGENPAPYKKQASVQGDELHPMVKIVQAGRVKELHPLVQMVQGGRVQEIHPEPVSY